MNNTDSYRRTVLAILVVIITVAFVAVMRKFLVTLLLAGIFSAIVYPGYRMLLSLFRGRAKLTAITTMVILVLLVVLPLIAFIGVLVSQAIQVTSDVGPEIQKQLAQRDQWSDKLSHLPFAQALLPYREQVIQKIGEATAVVGHFVVGKVSDVTRGTLSFLLQLFILLYAMFFFLIGGPNTLAAIMNHLPFSPQDRTRLGNRFLSVAKATIASSVVIGVVQGTLGGVGFAVAGIHGAVFWGTVMTVAATIPGVGTALVWVPTAIYLVIAGRSLAAIVFALYFILVVGMVDNLLRPRLVGRGTQLPELLVLLSTLGGIMVFGLVGLILGPVVAALFITLWDMQGESMREP